MKVNKWFIIDDNKMFGKKNKPRNEEPNMFDIMKWPVE